MAAEFKNLVRVMTAKGEPMLKNHGGATHRLNNPVWWWLS